MNVAEPRGPINASNLLSACDYAVPPYRVSAARRDEARAACGVSVVVLGPPANSAFRPPTMPAQPPRTGVVCPSCFQPVGVPENKALSTIMFWCPACNHRWIAEPGTQPK